MRRRAQLKHPQAFLEELRRWRKLECDEAKFVSTLNQISFDSMEQFQFNYEKFSDFISSFSTRTARMSEDDRIKQFQVSLQFL